MIPGSVFGGLNHGMAARLNVLCRGALWSLSARKRTRYAHCELCRSCEGFRMPAAYGGFRAHRRPAYENLQGRKPRWGDVRGCRGRYGDLSAADTVFEL